MARRSQCSSAGDNPLDPNYLPPHYREEYRLAIDALVEEDLEGYYQFLQKADVVDFLSAPEIQYIQGSIQLPQQIPYPEQQRFLEDVGDGSSDTYWPIHSDLDVPDLDLGWPQLQRFIGPTEVTTLVNPPEADMPSIKDQARRLIKNAQQVIAIVMDMFTDVDIFADILNAAMRNVAVYILLDQQDAHHFANMVANCRVNLESIQLLRVRTVSGITYHCRSGKSFKGQMMDRFLLTDCRAVLSGNYSFMWSFEKLHRCMAHLFLGQLVSTFDEEFRILYAQSQPLVMENLLTQMDEFNPLQKRQYPSEKVPLHRNPRKFLSMDTPHTDDWARHSHEENLDWRLKPLKRRGSLHGPADMYGRYPPQQSHMDPPFDQGPSRLQMMDNPALKRHSFAEGGHGRYSFPYMQQLGMPEPENQGRQFHRGQQPYPGPGKEDYSGYEKFWNQDFHADQYPEPNLPPEIEPPDFDPVLNYLSSTRYADIDQGSEKLPPAAGLQLPSSQPRRLSLGQPYACQTSPTPSNPTDQKEFFQEPNTDRKDPVVKRGLRNWRISSYLSAYDNSGDEGLPMASSNAPDAFEEPTNPAPQTALGVDLTVPKISKFKVPAIPRASQMPSYIKPNPREQLKIPDEPTVVAEETKTTPTPSESSSTTDGEKTEEAEQKEPKSSGLQREESFRRKYNVAIPRSSRLRSSLIFSSLEQQQAPQDTKTAPGQEDEESDKNEKKLPFVSQVMGQRRTAARESFEWSRYGKSSTIDESKPQEESSKEDDKDATKKEQSKDHSEKQETSSPLMPKSKESEAELPKTAPTVQPPTSMQNFPLHVDMSNPDQRLVFFKELAAKRKAAKAVEAEKSKDKAPLKPPEDTTVEKGEPGVKETLENQAATSEPVESSNKNAIAEDLEKTVFTDTDTCQAVHSSDEGGKITKKDCQVKTHPSEPQSCKEEQTRVSTDSKKVELTNSQSEANLSVPAGAQTPQSKSEGETKMSKPAATSVSASNEATSTIDTPAIVVSLVEGTDQSKTTPPDSSSKDSSSAKPSSVEVQAPAHAGSDPSTQSLKSAQLETSISSAPLLSEQQTGPELSSSQHSEPTSSSDTVLPAACSQSSPSPPGSAPLCSPDITPDVEHSTEKSGVLSSDAQESISSTAPEPSQSVRKTPDISVASSVSPTDSVSQLKSSEISSKVDSEPVQSDIPPDSCSAVSEPNISPSDTSTKTDSEESTVSKPSEKTISDIEITVPKAAEEESGVIGSEKDADSTPTRVSSLTESCSLKESESNTGSDQNETVTPTPSDEPLTEHTEAEKSSSDNSDLSPDAAQSDTNASPQDATIQVTPPSKLDLTGPATPTSSQTGSCSPLVESVGSVLPPKAEKTLYALQSPSETESLPQQVTTDSVETPVLSLTETSSVTEPTLQVPKDPQPQCETPESATSETLKSEPPELLEKSKIDGQNEVSKVPESDEKEKVETTVINEVDKSSTQESVCSEKTNDQIKQSNGTETPEVTSKQPKPVQSRYQSSTANVLSSSNLRDDTKLLLEQISANSQSRNEASKEAPVTDDEKEDEADKNAKREKERGIRSLSRAQPKSNDEREKLLEKLQSMRKERKVYSRFELAP